MASNGLSVTVGLCERLRAALEVEARDLESNQVKGLSILLPRSAGGGDLGDAAIERAIASLTAAYSNLFNRGAKQAKEALERVLAERMNDEEQIVLQRRAGLVYQAVARDVDHWLEVCRWLKDKVVARATAGLTESLGAGYESGNGRRMDALANGVNFGSQPRFAESALEIHVLGSADIIDGYIAPMAWPDSEAEKTRDELRYNLMVDSERGLVGLLRQAKLARSSATGEGAAWSQIVRRADSGELPRQVGQFAKDLVAVNYKQFLDDLTLDKALTYEAEYMVDFRQPDWLRILGSDAGQAVHEAWARNRGAAIAKVKEVRLASFKSKCVIVAQKAPSPTLAPTPAQSSYVLAGDPRSNPESYAGVSLQDLGAGHDDRVAFVDARWKTRMTLTQLKIGVELWWLNSFQKAYEEYNAWRAADKDDKAPLHTDYRFTRDWLFDCPSDTKGEVASMFFLLYAAGHVTKQAGGHFRIEAQSARGLPEEQLGQGLLKALAKLDSDPQIKKRCEEERDHIMSDLRNGGFPKTRTKLALEAIAAQAVREEQSVRGQPSTWDRIKKILAVIHETQNEFIRGNTESLSGEQALIAQQSVSTDSLKPFGATN
jgi:hypothetical protein